MEKMRYHRKEHFVSAADQRQRRDNRRGRRSRSAICARARRTRREVFADAVQQRQRGLGRLSYIIIPAETRRRASADLETTRRLIAGGRDTGDPGAGPHCDWRRMLCQHESGGDDVTDLATSGGVQ